MDKIDEFSAEVTTLLKRTKKSCLRFLRKMAPSKQTIMKKLEEEEISTSNVVYASTGFDEPSIIQQKIVCDEATKIAHGSSNESLTSTNFKSYRNYAVQDYELEETESDNEVKHSKLNDDNMHSDKMLHSLTSKLFLTADGYEMLPFQQLRSDTASEILQFESEPESGAAVFEKVKFKQHVRYFRNTPSNSSLDNFAPNNMSIKSDYTETSRANTRMSFQLDNINSISNKKNNNNNFTNTGLHKQQNTSIPQQNLFLPINVSLGLKADGSYQNVIITEERDHFNKVTPVVKWNINGDSLDEDNHNIYINDNWDEFDINMNHMYDKQFAQLKSDDSPKSSLRTSSTTLETWLEDEQQIDSYKSNNNEDVQLKLNFCLTKA